MRQAASVTAVIVLVALSGCLGSGTDPTAPSADGNGTDPGADATSSDGSDPEPGSDDGSASSDPDRPLLGNVTVDWDGSTGPQALICIPALYCTGLSPDTESRRDIEAPETDGTHEDWNRTLNGTLKLSWTAQDQTTEELAISLAWTEPCEGGTGGCTLIHDVASASGSSPVTLRLEDVAVPGNRSLQLDVDGQSNIHTDQSFHVEGTLTVRAADVQVE